MAKRFTDTDKWQKLWISDLTPNYKLFWVYLLDMVDNAGIYDVNLRLAEFQLGVKLKQDDIIKAFGKHIVEIKSSKWFIPKFVEFQYGDLNPANKAHLSVINKLKRYNLDNYFDKGHISPLNKAKDKDKAKVIVKNKRKPKDINEVKEYLKENKILDVDPLKFYSFYEANGWVQGKNKPIKNWKMCVNTWRTGEEKEKDKIEIILGCPKHKEVRKKTTSRNLFTYCEKCREQLIDINTLTYKQVIEKNYDSL